MGREGSSEHSVAGLFTRYWRLRFLLHGLLLLMPPAEIAAQLLMSLPRSFWVFLGVAEIAAAIGLTLPGLTRVMPFLVRWVVVGIMIVMISATGYHIVRGEYGPAATTFVLLIMADVRRLPTLVGTPDRATAILGPMPRGLLLG